MAEGRRGSGGGDSVPVPPARSELRRRSQDTIMGDGGVGRDRIPNAPGFFAFGGRVLFF